MKISVTFRHMNSTEALRAYAEEKISKVAKLLNDTCEAHVVLSVERHVHYCHVELITGGAFRVRADEKSEDMYQSIDLASDKLAKQVKRYREKVRDHRGTEVRASRELPHQVFRAPTRTDEGEELANEKPHVLRTETITAHTMTVDDALVKMDLLNSDFLVFTDQKNNQVSVMYRMPDGSYGLIEARVP
ncbi:MAG: ribosome-associated translation inhibitor RaiA [Myxococcota bacterium]